MRGPLAFLVLAAGAAPAAAGWRSPQGLGAFLHDAKQVAVYEVETTDAAKRVVTFTKRGDVRGALPARLRVVVPRENEVEYRAAPGHAGSEWLLRWATPGRRVVRLGHEHVYVGGGYWFQQWPLGENLDTTAYRLTEWHALFGYTFAGTADELAEAARAIYAGREVAVPVFAPTPFVRDTVMSRHWRDDWDELPLVRIKASLRIADGLTERLRQPGDDRPGWKLIVGTGSGRVGERSDPAALLTDARPAVRLATAGAALELDPTHRAALAELKAAAAAPDPAVRRTAAAWLWRLDRDVPDTVPALVALQRDADAGVRAAATAALKSFLTAYDLKGLSPADRRAARASPDAECARLADR